MKINIAFVLIIVAIFVQQSYSAPCKIKKTDIEKVLDNIPEKEKYNFLKYHILLGYDLAQKQNKWADTVTSELAMKLFAYAIDDLAIRDPAKLQAAQNIICFDDGTCIDIGDIGVHP